MKKKLGNIGGKVVVGYIVLMLIALGSLVYMYRMVESMTEEEDLNNIPRQKLYLVTNTQTLLYESEAMGQLLNMEGEEYDHFNETLDEAKGNIEALRLLVAEDELRYKLDTIDMLIERKRANTNALLEIWQSANKDLYKKNIESQLAKARPLVEEKGIKEHTISQKDTAVVISTKKRGFFQRLAEVFVPTTQDTSIVVSGKEHLLKDTLVNKYNPNEEVSRTLLDIQNSVANERQRIQELLVERSSAIRYDNSMINVRINQILRDMEEDEINASLDRVQKRQDLMQQMSYLISTIAVLSLIVGIFFLILIVRDLFKSSYYRKQLERMNKSREQLILTISHDVRAPLSSIIGYIELLQRSMLTNQQHVYLQNMGTSSKHILALVNDLLDFERLETGQIEVHQIPIQVPPFFEEIYGSFEPIAAAKGLGFSLQMKGESYKVYMGDSVRIRQIVGNLINNALKFTQKGSVTLLVDCSELALENQEIVPGKKGALPPSQLTITVRDTGPGISQEEQKRIFQEFARVAGTEKIEGFGLGLSITSRLVSLLGGSITVESEYGAGSDFIVTLPLTLSESESSESPVVPEEESVVAPVYAEGDPTCLIIDDDLLQIALVEEILKQYQMKVISTTDPENVESILQQNPINLILSDIQMPGIDGLSMIRQLRHSGLPNADTVPVIALSGSIDLTEDVIMDAGFTDRLGKPFTIEQLLAKIKKYIPCRQRPDFQATGEEATVAGNEGKGRDFSALTKFALGDQEASNVIIDTFFEETRKSLQSFQDALLHTDREKVSKISHRMVPLFSMLQEETIVQQLRILQMNAPELTDSGWKRLLSEVIEQISLIVETDDNV